MDPVQLATDAVVDGIRQRQHWLLFDVEMNVVGCACGFRSDLDVCRGYGDDVVVHLIGVGVEQGRRSP
jgi:hypothetical protein